MSFGPYPALSSRLVRCKSGVKSYPCFMNANCVVTGGLPLKHLVTMFDLRLLAPRLAQSYQGLHPTPISAIPDENGELCKSAEAQSDHWFQDFRNVLNIEAALTSLCSALWQERSCTDQIFTVKQIIEKINEHRTSGVLVFIDLRKAYNFVEGPESAWACFPEYTLTAVTLSSLLFEIPVYDIGWYKWSVSFLTWDVDKSKIFFTKHWTHGPFDAVKVDGKIFGRGSQDMKCVSIQYLEAIRKLKAEGIQPLRTIHLTFTPDEEIDSQKGMKVFVQSPEFKALNIGFSLDEGLANPTDSFTVFCGERAPWRMYVRCTGNTGHGSMLIPNTAAEKLHKIIGKFLEFRRSQEERLKSDPSLKIGDIVGVNWTLAEAGVQFNVIPPEMMAGFDLRIPPTMPHEKMEALIESWVKEGGEGCRYEFFAKHPDQTVTPTTDDNPWWKAFRSACYALEMKLDISIFPAATDSRYLRQVGIPALGFSPINNTPILLHEHNEYLYEDGFLKGIDIYSKIIHALADVLSF
ncbi:aminoacylase-1-like [Corticium candelabrum]|uniref:aminoacylase-1-like n=1 Tax=Corticium candelabrum TaxID=121492 RepID=UPI002E271B91|nr:aminoacylase-1-like [Corticium candelabrum]